MSTWINAILIVSGILFALKMAYVLCITLALPKTQGALYVSTARPRIAAALSVVPIKTNDRLIDLGCGDGRVLRMARKKGAVGVGYEINLMAYLKARTLCAGRKGITVLHRNFWQADLGVADIVCCYLFPDVMGRLATKLRKELKKGAVVISFNFPLPGFAPHRVLRPEISRLNDPIYIYHHA